MKLEHVIVLPEKDVTYNQYTNVSFMGQLTLYYPRHLDCVLQYECFNVYIELISEFLLVPVNWYRVE